MFEAVRAAFQPRADAEIGMACPVSTSLAWVRHEPKE
jgi:hypothetical protein